MDSSLVVRVVSWVRRSAFSSWSWMSEEGIMDGLFELALLEVPNVSEGSCGMGLPAVLCVDALERLDGLVTAEAAEEGRFFLEERSFIV